MLHGFDNVLVTGATAQIAIEQLANFSFAGLGVAVGNVNRAHDHAGGAKTTLQTVAFFEGRLHGVHGAIGVRQAFDGCDFCTLGLGREHVA